MTNRAPRRRSVGPAPQTVTWGTVEFRASEIITVTDQQSPPAQRVNAGEIDRQTQQGQQKISIRDFSGGLARYTGIGDVRRDLNTYVVNTGCCTRIPGYLGPAYLVTNQTSLTGDTDISAYDTTGRRAHAVVSSLGVAGLRYLVSVGNLLIGDTSLTDPTLLVRSTFTNEIRSIGHLRLNDTDYLGFGTNGQTDDLLGTASVTGSGGPSMVTLVSHTNAADVDWGIAYLPQVGPGINVKVGVQGGVNGIWWTGSGAATLPLTSLEPVVTSGTKDQAGSVAASTTAATAPSGAASEGVVTISSGEYSLVDGIDGLLLPYATDTATAQVFFLGPSMVSPVMYATFSGQFADVPLDDEITGIEVSIIASESSASADIRWNDVHLEVNGSQQGINFSGSDELVAAVLTASTWGGSDNMLGINSLSGADLQNIAVAFSVYKVEGANTRTADFDYVTLTITHRPRGSQAALKQGCVMLPQMPNFPNRLVMLEPESNDTTAITSPRRLVYLDFEYDTTGQRPVLTISYPNVGGMRYIHTGVPFQGGYAVAGGNAAGPGVRLGLVTADGKFQDFNFPAPASTLGMVTYRINNLFNAGTYLGLEVVSAIFTNLQVWFFDPNRQKASYFPDTVLQSITSLGITEQPLVFAENTLNLQQNRRYSIFPNGTRIAVRREYIPPDPNTDPRVADGSETLYAGVVYVQTMELEAGYPEASNSIMALDYQGRQISSSSGAYGTVRVQVDVTGDQTLAGAGALDTTFTAGHSATVASRGHYNVPSSGRAYQTIITRVSVDQSSTVTTVGPNGLNVLITTVQTWPHMPRYRFKLTGWRATDVWDLVDRLETLQQTQNAQTLIAGNLGGTDKGVPADWVDVTTPTNMPPRGAPPTDTSVGDVYIWFRKAPGSAAA